MELILSHTNADFDALGSMVGARRLYPGALIALGGSASPAVRDFLALHRELVDVRAAREIAPDTVTRLVIVDTPLRARLGEAEGLLDRADADVHLIDHHMSETPDVGASWSLRDEVGANCTLIVRELRTRQTDLTPVEATVMLIGIYEDTGFLAYSGTSAEDLDAAAWLVRAGGKLEMVREFTRRLLTGEQRQLFADLLAAAKTEDISGVSVCLAVAPAGPYVDDLAVLAHRLLDTESAQAAFVLAPMNDSLYVIGRSRGESLDVGAVLRELGGGGHARAGSATLDDAGANADAVRGRLRAAVAAHARPEPTARQIMSTPVRTIDMDASIAEARRRMTRYGHSGLVATEHGQMAGIITRRDVDKARHHQMAHAPVRGFMTREVRTAAPDTPLREIEERLIRDGVGRLPIVEHGQLVGVVTRTDVLRALHGARYVEKRRTPHDEIPAMIRERLPARVQRLLTDIGASAATMDAEAFAVGGFVRDLLWGERNLDVDIVTAPDALGLARAVAKRLRGKVQPHPQFQTATVTFADGFTVDISTARTETYARPGALPEVEPSTILDDLRRRDFSINAMAVNVTPQRFGVLLDPFHGREDQDRRRLRVLHNLSFVEDPTRLFRAARFAARFHFKLDPTTEALARDAVRNGALDTLSPERVRQQLQYIVSETRPLGALYRLAEWGVLKWLSPEARLDEPLLQRLPGALIWWREHRDRDDPRLETLVLYAAALLRHLSPEEAARVVQTKLRFSPARAAKARVALSAVAAGSGRLTESASPSDVTQWLRALPPEALTLLRAALTDRAAHQALDRFVTEWRVVRLEVDGDALKSRGWAAGPALGAALAAALAAKLNGEASGFDEEMAIAEAVLGERQTMRAATD